MLLALLLYSVPALAAIAPDWARIIAGKIRVTMSREQNEVLNDARFLGNYVHPGQQVVIMSYNSGLYHLLTQTTNPLDIPGDSELLLRRDFERQEDYALNKRGMFFVDKTTITQGSIDLFRRTNPVFYDNPAGTLIAFPAPDASPPTRGR